MRVSEGMGPTSMRSSTFANNTATAVLRFEGRTWVFKTDVFFAGIQFLDVLFYTQFQGASQAAYKFAELQHAQQQVRVGVFVCVWEASLMLLRWKQVPLSSVSTGSCSGVDRAAALCKHSACHQQLHPPAAVSSTPRVT